MTEARRGLLASSLASAPGIGLVDILVRARCALEDLVQSVLELELLHLRLIAVAKAGEHGDQALVGLARFSSVRGNMPPKYFSTIAVGAGDEVARSFAVDC